MDNFLKLQTLIAGALNVPVDKVLQTTLSEDLEEWDSLGHVHIMIALEGEFDIYMDVDDFAEIDGVPAILSYLESQLNT